MKVQYDNHAAQWRAILEDPAEGRVAETWLRDDTLDAWRHARMHRSFQPLLDAGREARWLTVGDGRYGTDAHFLLSQGLTQVVASDLDDTLLRVAASRGFIGDYSAQNAEAIGYADDSFDFVYCKEAYHHFPRPTLAVYEMLRVARQAVLLLEPNDTGINPPLAQRLLKRLTGRSNHPHGFEPAGNYVYTLSTREIEKLLLGVGLRHYAVKGVNDKFVEGVQFVPARGGGLNAGALRARIRGAIGLRDALCRFGLFTPTLIATVLFKREPSAALLQALRSSGFTVRELPLNPYAVPAQPPSENSGGHDR